MNSLTDVLKKTLFFFEKLSVDELTPYVQRRMLRDYSQSQVEEKVDLCLRQNPCFTPEDRGLWGLTLAGNRDNDGFYSLLLKKLQPVSIKELAKINGSKGNKKPFKRLVSEEASLISDGRFIQLDNGHWGLTEWELEAGQYSLKQLIIKALKKHPGGLSLVQLNEVVNSWRVISPDAIHGVLKKFPYFECLGEDIWVHNMPVQTAYESMTGRYLMTLGRQRERWTRERDKWRQKLKALDRQLQEVSSAHREVAAALALRADEIHRHDQLATQMAEKDLLLSLRKKEILRYREHISKLESKSNGILHQCRLWVARTSESQAEVERISEQLNKNQLSLEGLFTKLQQYKDKDRENKVLIAELKDIHSTKVAELQTEVVELKQKLEKTVHSALVEEKRLRGEIMSISNDLKKSLEDNDEAQRSLRFLQSEYQRVKETQRKLERKINNPLVKLIVAITAKFQNTKQDAKDKAL